MGPFVPEIFSAELNYVFALVIGIAFGFVLEQAGFSSSKTLTGLFYGRDFTVMKVFFTAAIVALVGTLFLNYFGLLNLDLVFVNPTFLRSAIGGGVIMGLGFIIGGFCPGTSVCAAAIGKIDAIFFIFGIIIGVLLFSIMYPAVESFYLADNWGNILVYDSLGISKGLFVFLLIIIAIGMFFVTSLIEKKVNKWSEHPENKYFNNYQLVVVLSVIVALVLLFLPDWKTKIQNNAKAQVIEKESVNKFTVDELAYNIIDKNTKFIIVDVRNPNEFKKSNIVGAINIPLDSMMNDENIKLIKSTTKSIIFYSNSEFKAIEAYFLAKELGHDYNFVLEKGFTEFDKIFYKSDFSKRSKTNQENFTTNFRLKAVTELSEIKKTASAKNIPKKAVKMKIIGGC